MSESLEGMYGRAEGLMVRRNLSERSREIAANLIQSMEEVISRAAELDISPSCYKRELFTLVDMAEQTRWKPTLIVLVHELDQRNEHDCDHPDFRRNALVRHLEPVIADLERLVSKLAEERTTAQVTFPALLAALRDTDMSTRMSILTGAIADRTEIPNLP